jgi:oligopeptide transport system ATP-binding protein
MTSSAPLVVASALTVEYPVRRDYFGRTVKAVTAVADISFEIGRGKTLGLVGESGCGKSSTARATLLLERPSAGEIIFDGLALTTLNEKELRDLRPRMQMIHQDPASTLNPRKTIGEIIGEPLEIHKRGNRRERDAKVAALLETVGLTSGHMKRYPHQFSGGQAQRIGIARALALDPVFVVCDEPTSALDVSVRAQVLNLLTDLQQERELTYLFIAHDLRVIDHVSDEIAVMYLGRIVERGSPRVITESARHPYTKALLSAMPSATPSAGRGRQRIVLEGDLPSPADPPKGCSFHTRCWLHKELGRPEVCVTERPELDRVAEQHSVACHFADDGAVTAGAQPSALLGSREP